MVLARELTFQEIRDIRAAFPPDVIELELSDASPRYIVRTDCPARMPELFSWAKTAGYAVDFVMRPTLATPVWRAAYDQLIAFSGKVRLVLPMVIRRWDLRVLRTRLPKPGELPFDVVASNPGHLPMRRDYANSGTRLHADFSLYQLNDWAYDAFRRWGVDGCFTLSLKDD